MGVAIDMGEVDYSLDTTEVGPYFVASGSRNAPYFSISVGGTWTGTVKLIQKTPSGQVVDVADGSFSSPTGEKQVSTLAGAAYAFEFTRTSGTADVRAWSRSGYLFWADAIIIEGITGGGVLLLENDKPLALE